MGVDWSNADAVVDFIDRTERYQVGDSFVLPDIGQRYEVGAVRPFKRDGKFYLFLDLFAECAVEGCSNRVHSPVEVNRWRQGRYLMRCCPEHRYQFQSPMPGAWKTLEERLVVRKPVQRRKVGVVQRVVLSVLQDYQLVGEKISYETLIRASVDRLPKAGKRDVRRQVVRRAYDIGVERGLIPEVA